MLDVVGIAEAVNGVLKAVVFGKSFADVVIGVAAYGTVIVVERKIFYYLV